MMKIRAANVADASIVQALFSQLEQETDHIAIGETDSLQLGAYLLQLATLPQQGIWLALADNSAEMPSHDAVFGFVMIMPNYLSNDETSAAVMFGLKQSHVGRGFGWQLLQFVEEWALKAGLTRLELTVKEANQTALRFYLRAGFKVKAPNAGVTLANQHGNVLYMVKDLV